MEPVSDSKRVRGKISLSVSRAEQRLIYRLRQISKADRSAVMVVFVDGDEVDVAYASKREKISDAR